MISVKMLKQSAIVQELLIRYKDLPPRKGSMAADTWQMLKCHKDLARVHAKTAPEFSDLHIQRANELRDKLGMTSYCEECAKKLNLKKDTFIKEK